MESIWDKKIPIGRQWNLSVCIGKVDHVMKDVDTFEEFKNGFMTEEQLDSLLSQVESIIFRFGKLHKGDVIDNEGLNTVYDVWYNAKDKQVTIFLI